jgi:osomolarity two-component system response regulator SSK1
VTSYSLSKPVNFVWLERKVMEWGCMQALIDFDGWRKWKDFSQSIQDEKKGKGAGAGAAGGGAGGRAAGLSRGGSEGAHEGGGGEVVAAKSKKKKNRSSVGSNPGASASRITILEEGDEGGKGGGVGLGVSDG